MKNHKISAVVIPTADMHLSEYISDCYKLREYLSGFTGSTAFLLIENETCVFFTDGRYTLQAKEQVHPQIEQVIVKTYQDVFKEYTSKYIK